MLVIGVTGGLGSGKSTVAAMFAKLGAKVLDADRIAAQQTQKTGLCFRKIVKAFGTEVLGGGTLDRKKLAKIVFADTKKLSKLEKIIHPVVLKEIRTKVRQYKRRGNVKAVVLDVPLLFESGLYRDTDVNIVVKASRFRQIQRAKKRLHISPLEALQRIQRQMPLKTKVQWAESVIDNNKTLNLTKKQVGIIWQKLLLKKKS